VAFVANQWNGGFTAEVRITNRGSAVNGWTLRFTVGAGVSLTNGWNGSWSQSGTQITIGNASWNGNIPSGGTVSTGFQGTGTLGTPTAITLNGTACT
jgi:endoglucanase